MTGEGKSWRVVAIVPSQGHALMITMLVVLVLAGGDVLLPVPKDSLPSLELTLERGRGVLYPIGEVLSHRTAAAPARARAVAGANGLVSPRGPFLG